MNIADFTQPQRQALLDLLVLAMYADGHLASAEDARLQRLLSTLGSDTDYDRGRQLDAAVTRVRLHSQTPEAARVYAAQLAQSFTLPAHRQQVSQLLGDLMVSDGQVSAPESRFLSVIQEVLQT
jgi:uncharacterized tellurite resistance protein B-like protein